jgi:DNA repair protein SbcD/Mre11
MRILHTSDWHVGKRLGRYDRMNEYADVLAEVERIANERGAELVLVSGDIWDRPIPPIDALSLGIETLLRLGATRPVVAVAGNHDSADLFEALAPLLRPRNVHLVGQIKRPNDGGVLGPADLGVPATIACFPFLREGRVVDFMRESGSWYGDYAERVAAICAMYNTELIERTASDPGSLPLLIAHFMVTGVHLDRGAPRGERDLHIGNAYAATPQAIPAGPQYVAMGHIHAPQAVPSSPVPAEYAGSLLALDFGEAGERKRVVIVDAKPGELAAVESVELVSGRQLVRVAGTWDQIEARRDELSEAFLDLSVKTSGVDMNLAERARETFPYVVKVRGRTPASEARRPATEGHRDWNELYADFYRQEHPDEDPPAALLALFAEVLEEAADATA